MNQDGNTNINVPLIYVSPMDDTEETGHRMLEKDLSLLSDNKKNKTEHLFSNNELKNHGTASISNNHKFEEAAFVDDLIDFNQNNKLIDFDFKYVNDVYLDDVNKLYPTISNQSDITTLSNINNKNVEVNSSKYFIDSSFDVSNNNRALNNFINNADIRNDQIEDKDDEIQSFYSAFGDVLLSSKQNIDIGSNNNDKYTEVNNESNESLHATFLLPDIKKYKSNSNGLLTVNNVATREGRRNSISKNSSIRSRSRSRSRSHSILSNNEEIKLLEDLKKTNIISDQDTMTIDNKNNLLQVANENVEAFSQVSEAELQEILKDLKDFDPLMGENKEATIVNEGFYEPISTGDSDNLDGSDKQFVCEFCSFAFLRKHDLKRHTAKHLNLKNYKCKGYLIGSLPLEAEMILFTSNNGKSYGNLSMIELADSTAIVEDVSESHVWGCERQFLRSDALNRHFKTKMGKECLHLAFKDFQSGNIYKTFEFLKIKDLINNTSKDTTTFERILGKDSGKMRDKFVECELLLKEMPDLNTVTWPMNDALFEEIYMEIYEKNLQKVIQRRVKLKKKIGI
ncbi:hypothetical protein QEN19_000702 [Hanseniaspora menglaensis]